MTQLIRISNALLSVSDKLGIEALGAGLQRHGVQLISTGGTRDALAASGLSVRAIESVTGNPEAFQGRMKTLSFQIGSGILFDRVRDRDEAARLAITPIDLVVCNLYPFEQHKELGLALSELIEHIDIGGPTMIRAAAKNFEHVAVLTNPAQYAELLTELELHQGCVSLDARRRWMAAAFEMTANYDTMIARHLSAVPLRYGENPHQTASFVPNSKTKIEILGGKELSYNNLVDLDAAIEAVASLKGPGCAIIKHENPCGLAEASSLSAALVHAWAGDPVSAFGSVIAFNRSVAKSDLLFLGFESEQRKFVEVVAAPAFEPSAMDYLRLQKNLRIVQSPTAFSVERPTAPRMRHLLVGTLIQSADLKLVESYQRVCQADSSAFDEKLADFGVHAVRCIKSNAIAIVRRHSNVLAVLGMGAGQPNRVKSTELAVAQARANLVREAAAQGIADSDAYAAQQLAICYLTSDAFFPFRDGVEHALEAGIRCIVQPGGSIRDAEVQAACTQYNATLVHTHIRHFKH